MLLLSQLMKITEQLEVKLGIGTIEETGKKYEVKPKFNMLTKDKMECMCFP